MMDLNKKYIGWNVTRDTATIEWISDDLFQLMDGNLYPEGMEDDIMKMTAKIDKIDIDGEEHIQISFTEIDELTMSVLTCLSIYFKDTIVNMDSHIITIPLKYYKNIMVYGALSSNIYGNELNGSFIYLSRLLISYYRNYIVCEPLLQVKDTDDYICTSLSNKDVVQLVDCNNTNLPSFNYNKDILKYDKNTMLYVMDNIMNSFRVVHKGIMLFVIDNIPLFLTEDIIYTLDELISKIHNNFYNPSVNSNMDAELYLLDVALRKYIKGEVELTSFTNETDVFKNIVEIMSRKDMTENDYDVVGRRLVFSLIMA